MTPPDDEWRHRLDRERAAADQLERVNGALELQAAVLALLLPSGSQRARRAWQIETAATPGAQAVGEHVGNLPAAARLPWFETLVSRLGGQPLATRQALLEATRRLMGARGTVRPIDRLYWLAMRQRLGEGASAGPQAPAEADLSRLPQRDVSAIAAYSAFLSRMVPVDATVATAAVVAAPGDKPNEASSEAFTQAPTDAPTPPSPGEAWYDTVMKPWRRHASVEPCRAPDTDGLVHALHELQSLAWMQRPMLVRGWFAAAQKHSRHGRIEPGAADALRLSCRLLDSPMPPDLARHYGESSQPTWG